jgi:CBS domain-containing protein
MILHTKETLQLEVSDIMDKNLVILDESASIYEAAKVMQTKGISSVLVKDSHSGTINGIVTERDILYEVVAESKGIFEVKLHKIMSSPLVTVEKDTRSIEAIMIMRKKGIRRLPVIDNGNIVGIVTLMSLVGNMPVRNIDLAELDIHAAKPDLTVRCPYCQSKFDDKTELSSHIDRIHLGSGLLEGNLRNWE